MAMLGGGNAQVYKAREGVNMVRARQVVLDSEMSLSQVRWSS